MWSDFPCKIALQKPFNNGYVYVRRSGSRQKIGLHVLALERKLGRPLKPHHWALHHCDVRNCVEEEHLWEGTCKQNTKDAYDKGRRRGWGLKERQNDVGRPAS
jgi:hypothetical protein